LNWKVRASKRILDFAASVAGLAATLPLYPLIALAIKLDSPGPILYRQRRAGRLNDALADPRSSFHTFWMYKFRTMRTDAEAKSGPVMAGEGDPRITRVGRFLRKSRLDELPQFYNVLRGEMSLVGPRPERPELLANMAAAIPFFEERLRMVKPGITGLAQIQLGYSGRMRHSDPLYQLRDTLLNPFKLDGVEDSEADDMRTKMLYDLAYSASLEDYWQFVKTELSIIARTPLVMILGRGR
jgi:lipopolysaccharide/colanic/teichoic acid biosynthesis glycosyltransferase